MLDRARKKAAGNNGFTLVELIVVVAIIGILMSLAVPRLIGYTEEARETADEQLAALYGNTFDILLGSGKVVNTSTGNVTIIVDKTGKMGNPNPADALMMGDTKLDSAAALTSNIQDVYISKSRTGGTSELQSFKSKKYSGGEANGISITVTGTSDVQIGINTAATEEL